MPLITTHLPMLEHSIGREDRRASIACSLDQVYDDYHTLQHSEDEMSTQKTNEVPVLPQRSTLRASRNLDKMELNMEALQKDIQMTSHEPRNKLVENNDGLSPNDDVEKIHSLETPTSHNPHDIYLSSDSDTSSISGADDYDVSTISISLISLGRSPVDTLTSPTTFSPISPIDSEREHEYHHNRDSIDSQEDTARIVSFMFVGKPLIIDISPPPSRSVYPEKKIVGKERKIARKPALLRLDSKRGLPLHLANLPQASISTSNLLSFSSPAAESGFQTPNQSLPRSTTFPIPVATQGPSHSNTPRGLRLVAKSLKSSSTLSLSVVPTYLSNDPFPSPSPSTGAAEPTTPTRLKNKLESMGKSFEKAARRRPSMGRLVLRAGMRGRGESGTEDEEAGQRQSGKGVVDGYCRRRDSVESVRSRRSVAMNLGLHSNLSTPKLSGEEHKTVEPEAQTSTVPPPPRGPIRYQDIMRSVIRAPPPPPMPMTPTSPVSLSPVLGRMKGLKGPGWGKGVGKESKRGMARKASVKA
jgi:hypothetical protein